VVRIMLRQQFVCQLFSKRTVQIDQAGLAAYQRIGFQRPSARICDLALDSICESSGTTQNNIYLRLK
jgi:hypothetical protein